MPELPEVETIRRGLAKNILGKKITALEVKVSSLVKTDLSKFQKTLVGNSFAAIERIGKLLMFKLKTTAPLTSKSAGQAGHQYLLIHLKMTGQLIYQKNGKTVAGGHNLPLVIGNLPNKFTHITFSFADQSNLFFNDMRKFGYMKLVSEVEKEKIEKGNFGPDALTISWPEFKTILEKKKNSRLKATLLNQGIIAGIGNIYADEICFHGGVLPTRVIKTITPATIKKLYEGTKKILAKAVECGGTTFGTQAQGNYVTAHGHRGNYCDYLKVYDRKGEPCLRCKKGTIAKKAVAGRGTSFCPSCQK